MGRIKFCLSLVCRFGSVYTNTSLSINTICIAYNVDTLFNSGKGCFSFRHIFLTMRPTRDQPTATRVVFVRELCNFFHIESYSNFVPCIKNFVAKNAKNLKNYYEVTCNLLRKLRRSFQCAI